MHTIVDKATNSARTADRMGDNDVISISLAKQLIEEAYLSGANSVLGFLKKRNDSCNCADAVESLCKYINEHK